MSEIMSDMHRRGQVQVWSGRCGGGVKVGEIMQISLEVWVFFLAEEGAEKKGRTYFKHLFKSSKRVFKLFFWSFFYSILLRELTKK